VVPWLQTSHVGTKNIKFAGMNLVSMVDGLRAHPVLCNIDYNTVVKYTRFIGHLKQDILLPQPLDQSNINQPPEILPPSIAEFLAAVTDVSTAHIQNMWDILKEHLWDFRFSTWKIKKKNT
jgi:hypothetical protein